MKRYILQMVIAQGVTNKVLMVKVRLHMTIVAMQVQKGNYIWVHLEQIVMNVVSFVIFLGIVKSQALRATFPLNRGGVLGSRGGPYVVKGVSQKGWAGGRVST